MASEASIRGTILRYKADRLPVAFVLFMFGVHVLIWALAPTWVAAVAMAPLVFVCTCVAPINHHHQHVNTFRSPLLNRLYELTLAMQTGISPYGWVLHHNLGHHQNYLHQYPHESPDESHWTRKSGATMGRAEYTLHLFLHHQIDIYNVGKKYPKQWRYYLLMKIPVYGLLGLMAWVNPVNTLLVWIIPGMAVLMHTCYATYEHHAGHHPTSHYDASVNRESPVFNFVTCNLGLHTAHHKQPGLHWSLLPELHAKIRDKIPEEQLLQSFW